MISYIVATDKKRAIGKDNLIPWRISSDRVLLKKLTLDNTVILGRKTYDSMTFYYNRSGRPMPGKLYIVITRDTNYVPKRDNAIVAHSVDEALEQANQTGDEIFVIGGNQVYELFMSYVNRIYLTEVDADTGGDTFFPPLDKSIWSETSRVHHLKNDKDEFDFDMVVLDRTS